MTEFTDSDHVDETLEEDDMDVELFIEHLLTFPCFEDARLEKPSEEIFKIVMDAYQQDDLTEDQDMVVELLVHMTDPSTAFNLKRASEIWSAEDLDAFWAVICPEDTLEEENPDENN